MILLSTKYEYKDANRKIVEKKNPNLRFEGSLISENFIYLILKYLSSLKKYYLQIKNWLLYYKKLLRIQYI